MSSPEVFILLTCRQYSGYQAATRQSARTLVTIKPTLVMKELKSTEFTCICGRKIPVLKTLEKHIRRNHNHIPEREKLELIKDLSSRIKKKNDYQLKLIKNEINNNQTAEQKAHINSDIEEFKNALLPILDKFLVQDDILLKIKTVKSLTEIKSLIVKSLSIGIKLYLELNGFDLCLPPKPDEQKFPKTRNKSKKKKKNIEVKSIRLIYTPMGNKR